MTTLVTGAAGFVGYHVTRVLIGRVKHVRVLIRPTACLRTNEGLACECVYGDLRDPSSLRPALEGVRQVFHVAADYRLWARNPNELYDNTVVGTRNLVRPTRQAAVLRFV